MRRRRAEIRQIQPDPIYNDVLVTRFINKVMWDGKKNAAERIFYKAMNIISEKTGKDALEVFKQAVQNASPLVEVRPRRVGGATYQVPLEVRESRKVALALRWIIGAARARKGKPMEEKLAAELLDAYQGTGVAVKKRDDTHRMAEANKAFSHYKW
ncbi:MAG: 30S ribosomal protein S7 [Thermotogae bacterium]|nr:30S ribosomal protein S7 [Thermotogota bacterium]